MSDSQGRFVYNRSPECVGGSPKLVAAQNPFAISKVRTILDSVRTRVGAGEPLVTRILRDGYVWNANRPQSAMEAWGRVAVKTTSQKN